LEKWAFAVDEKLKRGFQTTSGAPNEDHMVEDAPMKNTLRDNKGKK
jgi:hypothetical protein